MTRGRKRLFFILGGVLLILVVKLLLDLPYRSNLPALPDLQLATDSLREQVKSASRKAYLNPSSDNMGMLGMIYHSSENYERAAECYKLALRKDPSAWLWNYYLGYLSMEMGESQNSIDCFEAVIKTHPSTNFAWYYIGKGYLDLGIYDKAESAFLKIAQPEKVNARDHSSIRTDFFPLHIYARYQLARISMNSGKTEVAEKILQDLLKENRTFGAACRLLGTIYEKKGDLVQSKKCILRANDLTTYSVPIDNLADKITLISKSDPYLMKQIDEAIRTIYPEYVDLLLNHALQIAPKNKFVISKAVRFYVEIGAVKLALPYLNKHLTSYMDDADELREMADLLRRNGAYSPSLVYYRQSIRLKPNVPGVQYNFALALFKAGMKDQSLDYVNRLLTKDKSNPEEMSNGIYTLLTMGETEKAKASLASLDKSYLNNPKIEQCAGMIAEQEGKRDIAISQYEKSYLGDPKDLATIQMLGNLLVANKLWVKAIDFYTKVQETHPNEAYLLERLGTLLISCPDEKLRKIKEGMEYAERALDHKSCPMETEISAGTSLSDGYLALGDKQTAISYLKSVINVAQSSNAPESYLTSLGRKLKVLTQ